MEYWEHYDEDAGIGVRGFGETQAGAFEQAALALSATFADPQGISPREHVSIECEAADEDLLLAAWLDALLQKMRETGMLFSRFEVRLSGLRLRARAWGEPEDPERHHPRLRVKRASEKTLRVARHGEGWMAQTLMQS